MNKKTIAIVSYLTFIGWIIAYLQYKKSVRSSLTKYHLEQSFGLGIIVITSNIVLAVPILFDDYYILFWILNNLCLIILWIAGIISAFYGVRLPLPVIGTYFEDKFEFIQ